MEDRYEIKSKIGQGGLGSVYRAYDMRMNREVAIKRITTSDEDGLLEEAAKQLSKEAGALASLQHPNIVTVYDVGSDDDGPYVVMELLSGKTLDVLIEQAPLTWDDFRELAMQSQEALIAAQELNLVHRDIKPGNVMLTWLPSGKFQIKLVDFGLAKLAQRPSLQTLDQNESVFGSIYFMAPEQFERAPLDARTDIYAMGCVYYNALAGCYPFDGQSAAEVMGAHLHHDVIPLKSRRPDLPTWVCDWVMWQMNRTPDDRPATAREALHVFIQNDRNPPPEMPTPEPARRPRLIIPGAAPPEPEPESQAPSVVPIVTKTAPQPLMPPTGSKPSVHTSSHDLPTAEQVMAETVETVETVVAEPVEEAPKAAPVLLKKSPPPTVDAPVEATGTKAPTLLKRSTPTGAPASAPIQTSQPEVSPPQATATAAAIGVLPHKKKGMNNSAKMAIAVALGVLVILFGWFLMKRSAQNRETDRYNQLIAIAGRGDTTEVPMNRVDLDIFLRMAMSIQSNTERETVYKALFLATPTDGTDIDAEIVRFATQQQMMESVRTVLISQVLRRRGNPQIVAPLLDYAKEHDTSNPEVAVAAMQAVRRLVDESHFEQLLQTLQFTSSVEMRRTAEEALSEILDKSTDKSGYASQLSGIFRSSVNDDARHAALRLFGRIGDQASLATIRETLNDGEVKDKIAALSALSTWGNDLGFPVLVGYFSSVEDPQMRNRAFESAMRYAIALEERGADAAIRRDVWSELVASVRTSTEQERVVRGMAVNHTDEWISPMIENFAKTSEHDRVIDVAERALFSISERRRAAGLDPVEEKKDGE